MLFWILMGVGIVALISSIVISMIQKDAMYIFFGVVAFIVFIFASICVDSIHSKQELKDRYMSGCECGGTYQMIQAIGHARSTSYLYECENCGDSFESYTLFTDGGELHEE